MAFSAHLSTNKLLEYLAKFREIQCSGHVFQIQGKLYIHGQLQLSGYTLNSGHHTIVLASIDLTTVV